LPPSLKNTKITWLYCTISLGEIILSGLATWGALELWSDCV
jgi:hypothetical protein